MFHRMKMPFKLKTTALALQDRTVATNILIEKARRSLRNSERPEGRAEVEPLDNIVVRNLIYNGQSGIFNGEYFIRNQFGVVSLKYFFR